MTCVERLSLATEIDALGAAALGDVVLDLGDASIAAWGPTRTA